VDRWSSSTRSFRGFIFIVLIAASFYYPARPFDKNEWQGQVEKRYELADDLINKKTLIGRTKAEVKELLGDETSYSQTQMQQEIDEKSNNWIYYIGYKPRPMRIDADFLQIKFNNGHVITAEQTTQ